MDTAYARWKSAYVEANDADRVVMGVLWQEAAMAIQQRRDENVRNNAAGPVSKMAVLDAHAELAFKLVEQNKKLPPSKMKCPDDGICHHQCRENACFRVRMAAPFTGHYPDEPDGKWPLKVMRKHGARVTHVNPDEQALTVARRYATYELGEPLWADRILNAYLNPRESKEWMDRLGA